PGAAAPRARARRRDPRLANGTRAARDERLDSGDRLRGAAHALRPRRHRLLVGLRLLDRGGGALARGHGDGRAARARRGSAAVLVRAGQRPGGRGRGGRGAPTDCREGASSLRRLAPMNRQSDCGLWIADCRLEIPPSNPQSAIRNPQSAIGGWDAVSKRVLVAMSGGVDSSVAAAVLVEAGYDVVGATMKLFCYGDQ